MVTIRIPEPVFLKKEKYCVAEVDTESKLRKSIECSYQNVGKEAFGDANFDIAKWIPAITAGTLFLLPGTLFGPIGLALVGIFGVTGFFVMDKLMENEFAAKYINKPKWALQSINEGESEKAIEIYDEILESYGKARKNFNQINKIPKVIKKLIFNQIGREVSAKDFEVYESVTYYAQGLLYESRGEMDKAEDKYFSSFKRYGNGFFSVLRALTLPEENIDKDKWFEFLTEFKYESDEQKAKMLEAALLFTASEKKYSAYESNIIKALVSQLHYLYKKFNYHEQAEQAQAYLLAFYDELAGKEVELSNEDLIELKGKSTKEKVKAFSKVSYEVAALLACKHFEEIINNAKVHILEDSLSKVDVFSVINKMESERVISSWQAKNLHSIRITRNKIIHDNIKDDQVYKMFIDNVTSLNDDYFKTCAA